DLVGAGGRRIVIERDLLDLSAGLCGRESQALVRRVEVVRRRQDVVAGPQPQTVVRQAEAHRRAVGEHDLVGAYPEVVGGRGAHLVVVPGRLVNDRVRIGVQLLSPTRDRVPHGFRMPGEYERGELRQLGVEGEAASNLLPVVTRDGPGRSATRFDA